MKPHFTHLINSEGFQFNDDSFKYYYELVHQMSDNIEVCRCADFRLLIFHMGYVKRHIDLAKTSNHELEKYVESRMMDGLTDDDKFQDVRIMGAIVHPIFQSKLRMVAAGLCTEM